MESNVKARLVMRFCNKKLLIVVSFLFMVILIFSPLISKVNGTSVVSDIVVGNEAELLNAISTAPNKKTYVISLSDDISLKTSLEIPKNKNITLVMSYDASNFVSLIGSDGTDTIVIKSKGTLVLLEGVVVTHVRGDSGRGVYVESKGTFILAGGEISGNTVNNHGVGVYNYGAGVYNQGIFKMYSGKILNNIAIGEDYGFDYGGGVYNAGNFVMSDGLVSNNTAGLGGGVSNDGTFNMLGGTISGNIARSGGGVNNNGDGTFVMSGGEITCNTASHGGGVAYWSGTVKGTFTLSGGKIFNNTATNGGNGYSNDLGEGCVDGWSPLRLFVFLLIYVVPVVVIVIIIILLFKRLKR